MLQDGVLTPEKFLLTLLVKLAAVAVLATMLARYRRFRHILIFERRGWVDRLVFTLSFGVPLMAGVTSRWLLDYRAADLSLEGAFLAPRTRLHSGAKTRCQRLGRAPFGSSPKRILPILQRIGPTSGRAHPASQPLEQNSR